MKKIALIFSILLMAFLVACWDDDSNNNKSESQNTQETLDETNGANSSAASEDDPEQDNNENGNDSEENNAAANNGKTLDGLVAHFEDSGFDIGENTEKVPEMIEASNGFGIELDGEEIEIYEFEPDSEDLDDIQSNEEVEMEGFGPFPALANERFVIINHDEHSEEEEIVDVFESF